MLDFVGGCSNKDFDVICSFGIGHYWPAGYREVLTLTAACLQRIINNLKGSTITRLVFFTEFVIFP
jgi:hypothetical protein